MRYLIDTNVVIPLEPTAPEHVEAGTASATALIRAFNEAQVPFLIHPACLQDLARDQDPQRAETRDVLMGKYAQLEAPPSVTTIAQIVGTAEEGTNSWVDDMQLAAVHANAVTALITEDGGIHRKARRLGIEDRVLTVQDAIAQIATLMAREIEPPPAAEYVPIHTIDTRDPIFDSLRLDYDGEAFDQWWARCAQDGRKAFVVDARAGAPRCAALCVVKGFDNEYGVGPRALKVSTLKVSDEYQGNRYGELLLKALFRHCADQDAQRVWLTAFDHHDALIALLEEFGFQRHGLRTERNETIWVKDLCPRDADPPLAALDHHVRYGPPALLLSDDHTYLVPIQPVYHELLFPDAEPQQAFQVVDPRPFGNAIRKAYLCNAPIRRLEPGDTLLFYRSHSYRGIWTVGVVEEAFVSSDVAEIAQRVGTRTVYSFSEIDELTRREALAILFRQDRVLDSYISEAELIANGVMLRGPQTIASVDAKCVPWLIDRIAA